MTATRGRLLAIEGIDGAGKHTLAEALETALRAAGHTVAHIAFPRYGTRHADLAAAALRGRLDPLADSAEAMALLFALDRADALDHLARLRATNDVVIADRFVASNAAYTTARLGLDRFGDVVSWIATMEHDELGIPRPDAYLLLATPPAVARTRADDRASRDVSRELDAYERNTRLQHDTAAVYARMAAEHWQAPWWRSEPGEPAVTAAAAVAEKLASFT